MGAPAASSIALAAAGQPVEDADDPDDLVARLAQGVERQERGASRGHDVLDDHAAILGVQSGPSRGAAARAPGLLAHEERLHVGAARQRGAGDGVCPTVVPPTAVASQARARSATSSASAWHAGRSASPAWRRCTPAPSYTAGEHDFAQHEGVSAQLGDEALGGRHAGAYSYPPC